MNHLMSMYIDNELSLNEKILFLNLATERQGYADEAIALLEQEKILAATLNVKTEEQFSLKQRKPLHMVGVAMAACLLLMLAFFAGGTWFPFGSTDHLPQVATSQPDIVQHRFVLYRKGTAQVEVLGSFTNWQKVPMQPAGMSGYWEVSLQIPSGEHRYSFVVDGVTLVPDPTSLVQEPDDFGTINSILIVES